MPFFAPASMAMLHIVKRSSIERYFMPSPANSIDLYSAPSTPIMPMMCSIMSLPQIYCAGCPLSTNFIACGTLNQHLPLIIPAAMSVEPTPVEKAPSAPYVQVWLSAPITRSPAPTSPCSGSSACSMPILPTSKKFSMPCPAAKSRHILHCCALFMSLLGAKWSITSAIFALSFTRSAPDFSNSFIATGPVMSFASTISRSAIIS